MKKQKLSIEEYEKQLNALSEQIAKLESDVGDGKYDSDLNEISIKLKSIDEEFSFLLDSSPFS